MKRNEKGSITIETCLALPIFMFGFLAILSLAKIAKIESMTQYAIDQVAKEISQYYYIADKIGIANTGNQGVEEVDEAIQAVVDFNNLTSTTVQDYSQAKTAEDLANLIQSEGITNVKNDVAEITAAADKVSASMGPILEDPKGIATSLATMLIKEIGNEVMTKVIAQPLCKALVPKYITSDGDVDQTLKDMGVVNGLDGLDFRMSSFLTDQRSINVVVIYEIELEGYGIFDRTIVIKQTASTAAWVTGTPLSEVSEKESTWEKDSLSRGKSFVEELKLQNPNMAVKAGIGVDLYEQSTNTFTSVSSMNVFSKTYSDYKNGGNSPSNYSLKKDKIKSTVKGYANELKNDMKKIGGNITMEDGSMCMTAEESVAKRNGIIKVVVPAEANDLSEHLAILNEVAAEVQKETGIKVEFTYREEALGG